MTFLHVHVDVQCMLLGPYSVLIEGGVLILDVNVYVHWGVTSYQNYLSIFNFFFFFLLMGAWVVCPDERSPY